jgi:hypothetical protein
VVERTVLARLANATKPVDAAPTSSQGPDKRLLIGVAAAAVVVVPRARARRCATATSPSSSTGYGPPNVSAEGRTFFAWFNTLSDGTTVFEADDEAWLYLGNMVAEVAPGASIETEVVFDVPKGTDLESIWLRGGPLSDGVAVAL